MSATLNLGTDGQWATKENSLLGYNSENGNYKPLPFDFTRASNGTFVNKSGLIETAANGVPRIDFSDSTSGALLLEPQRTNLITYSSDFSQWSGSGYITSNYAISPDGTQNATRCLFTGANQVLSKTSTLPTGVSCSATFYVKGVSGETIRLAAGGADTTHLLNGSWQRIETNSTSINSTIVLNTFGGATARDLLIYGAQLELGSYATSLINTQGSAVTRVADVCSQTVPDGIIGQTEGTMYCEIDFKSKPEAGSPIVGIIALNNNVSNLQNCIILGIERQSGGTNRFYPFVQVGNSTVAYIIGGTLTDGVYKAAFAYKENDFVLYVNGVQIGTDTLGAVPATSQVLVGERYNNDSVKIADGIKETKLYNTRLTNAELATLTTI